MREAEADECVALLLGLDALGHDVVELQRLGQVQDRAHQTGLGVGAGERGHELARQLDAADGQLTQVAERGVAGAEVVDVEPDAQLGELAEPIGHDALTGQQHALGDLEQQAVGGDAAHRQRELHVVDDAGVHAAGGR